MSFPRRLHTARLVLHRWDAPAHTSALAAVNADPETTRFLNAGVPYTLEQSTAQSARFAAHWDTYGFGLWAVEAAGAIVGFTGVCHPVWFPAYAHEVEVGWRLHRSVWGNGYATEAGHAALEAAFLRHVELARVIACIDLGNLASSSVARNIGMELADRVTDPHDPSGQLEIWERRRLA